MSSGGVANDRLQINRSRAVVLGR